MSWQSSGAGLNRNAQPWGQQPANTGYYPPQGQPGAYYPPGQQGAYYPPGQQGAYYPPSQQGAYYPPGQQGAYYPPGQQGAYYPTGQQVYPSYQPQNVASQPTHQAPPAPDVKPQQNAPAQPSHDDLVKLGLAKREAFVPPKGRGKRLVLSASEEPKKVAEETTVQQPSNAQEQTPEAASTSPTAPGQGSAPLTPITEKPAVPEKAPSKKRAQKTYVRDPRPHYNIVFCGHVDAGKSTINGDLLIAHGAVDDREMTKLRREAEINHREGWEKAYVFDLSEEERAKGKTHETGAGYFETANRRITVLDAPGHKAFVPSMIGGAAQADLAVMVISARRGEFEAGFENGGQTREHTTLLRTCGVKHLICVINKMDDCEWMKERYDEITGKLAPFFKQNGFQDKKNLVFMPVAGLLGLGIAKPVGRDICSWYTGPYLLEYINELTLPETRSDKDVLCLPVVGAIKDDGKTFVYGKIESGSVAVGDEVTVLPTNRTFVVEGIQVENTEIEKSYVGDNVHIRVKGLEEQDFHPGFVITQPGEQGDEKLRSCEFFQAVIMILEVDNIVSNGTKVMLHAHSAQTEVTFDKLLAQSDPKTLSVIKKEPAFAKAGECIVARLELAEPLTLAPQKDFDKLGRFMLRDKGRTIAIGRVLKLYESTHESLTKRA